MRGLEKIFLCLIFLFLSSTLSYAANSIKVDIYNPSKSNLSLTDIHKP